MGRKKKIDKKLFKKVAGCCRICKEDLYEILDTHRIVPGAQGGEYTQQNSTCLCSNCHRKVHSGTIEIDRYYLCTNGQYVLRIIEEGEEKFV